MNDSTFSTNGRERAPTLGEHLRSQTLTDGERASGQASPGAPNPSAPAGRGTKPGDPDSGRVRRILLWVIAGVAVLVAAIVIGILVVNASSEPQPVARLAVQTDRGSIPVDEEAAQTFESVEVTQADFVSHGSYGALDIWSATTPEKNCLALVAGDHVSVFHCTEPTFDTIADFDIEPNLVPPGPSGEPAGDLRFILHDKVVHVYLAPDREGGSFY